MFLISCIAVIVLLLWIAESQTDVDTLAKEKIKLDKQLYLNLRSKR